MAAHDGGDVSGDGDRSFMTEPMVMMAVDHYGRYRWVQAPIAALSLWLIVSPFTLGYSSPALIWSDVVSGVVVLGMALFALKPRRGLVSWLISFVGLWLLFAPLAFWSPDADRGSGRERRLDRLALLRPIRRTCRLLTTSRYTS